MRRAACCGWLVRGLYWSYCQALALQYCRQATTPPLAATIAALFPARDATRTSDVAAVAGCSSSRGLSPLSGIALCMHTCRHRDKSLLVPTWPGGFVRTCCAGKVPVCVSFAAPPPPPSACFVLFRFSTSRAWPSCVVHPDPVVSKGVCRWCRPPPVADCRPLQV